MKKNISKILCIVTVTALICACFIQTATANAVKISEARNSILRVICDSSRFSYSTGTAFVIAQSEDATYLVTNYHVIEGDTSEVYIITDNIDGTWIPAKVEHFQRGLDLVILSVSNGLEDRPALPLVRTKNVDAAETVYALGFPGAADEVIDDWDLLLSGVDDVTITNGIVSNASRKMDNGVYAIQTTVPLTYGNSGGPLLNENAEVIGVNTWIYSEGAFGLSYSIHIDYIIDMCITYAIPYVSEAAGEPYEPPEGYVPPVVTEPEPEPAPAITMPEATPETYYPLPRADEPDAPVSRGFLYDNLSFVVTFGLIIIIALVTLVIYLVVRQRSRYRAAMYGQYGQQYGAPYGGAQYGNQYNGTQYGSAPYGAAQYGNAQYGTYIPPAPQPQGGGWFSRNKLAVCIISAGLVVAVVVGVVLPFILSPGSDDNNSLASAIPESSPLGTPAPMDDTSPAPSDSITNHVVIGSWKLTDGHPLYHFGQSDSIAFFSSGDVYSSDEGKWASWRLSDDSQLVIVDDTDLEYHFTIDISGDTLTVEDSDGDKASYENVNTSLVGDWSFSDGDWIWVFGRSSLLTFNEDSSLYILDSDETTTWKVDSSISDSLTVYDSEYDALRDFRFCIISDVLVIIDEDGDVAGFRRN